jgi:hypothetical protein
MSEGLAEAFGLFGAELRREQGAQGDHRGEREHLLHQVDHLGPARHGGRDLLPHHGHIAAPAQQRYGVAEEGPGAGRPAEP